MKFFGLSITRSKPAMTHRASGENPSTPLSDIGDDDDAFFGLTGTSRDEMTAGRSITRNRALSYAAFWRGTTLIASDVAKLPIYVNERDGTGKSRDPSHAAFELLRHKPNREMTAFIFWQTVMAHVLLEGNGYAYISRAGDGTPVELIPLNPTTTYPVRANGVLYYVVQVQGSPSKVAAQDVLHFKGLGFDGLVGYSVLHMARETLNLGLGVRTYGSQFFRNGAQPGVALEYPGVLTEVARRNLRKEWNDMHAGLSNAHKVAVLQEGMSLKTFSINARDAQLLEIRQFEIREIANFFGVPPHKLGDTTRTAFASLEQENQSYLDDALDPRLVMIEQECRDKLLTEQQKTDDTHSIEFLRQALVRANLADRAAFYTAMVNIGVFSPDEVRSRESMNPQPNGTGEVYYRPLNMATVDSDGNVTNGTADPAVPDAIRTMAIDAVTRMCKRLKVHADKPTVAAADPEKHRAVITDAMKPVALGINAVRQTKLTPESITQVVIDGFRTLTPEAIVESLMNRSNPQ